MAKKKLTTAYVLDYRIKRRGIVVEDQHIFLSKYAAKARFELYNDLVGVPSHDIVAVSMPRAVPIAE